eukprot:Colp12_sorted_trinity150504_noHs@14934
MEYGAPKRMRIDELGGSVPAPPVPMDPNTMSAPMMGAGPNMGGKRPRDDSGIDPHAPPPSRVVHGGAPSDDMGATRILLLTIINPLYPITTEVIHAIATPYGLVEKIVIFHKNGVQALVQYDNAQSASRAKASLQGADIYAGCCTLKVDFSRVDQLNVRKNDDLTWDYTSGASGPASAPPPTNY